MRSSTIPTTIKSSSFVVPHQGLFAKLTRTFQNPYSKLAITSSPTYLLIVRKTETLRDMALILHVQPQDQPSPPAAMFIRWQLPLEFFLRYRREIGRRANVIQ